MGKLSAAKKKEYAKEYSKQKRRINRYIRTKQKQGFTFDDDLRIQGRPQNITKKDIEKLKRITPEKILKQASYLTYDRENKEVKYVGGLEGRKIHAKEPRELTANRKRFESWQREVEDFESQYGGFYGTDYFYDEPEEPEQPESDEVPDDYDMLVSELANMLLEFDPGDHGLKGRPAHIAQQEISRLFSYLYYQMEKDPSGLAKRVAENWDELRSIVDRVQNYVNVHGDATRFLELISGETLNLEENLAATGDYNDSDALTSEEIEDYDIVDE